MGCYNKQKDVIYEERYLSMIYVTGDTHGSHDFAKIKEFLARHSELSKSDYLIIAGDFGAVWNCNTLDEDLKKYIELPFTVLFVDPGRLDLN